MQAMVLRARGRPLILEERPEIQTATTRYSLHGVNDAVSDLRGGRIQGAAVLVP
jgi:hypothetical protein